jgi:hypothetical protein
MEPGIDLQRNSDYCLSDWLCSCLVRDIRGGQQQTSRPRARYPGIIILVTNIQEGWLLRTERWRCDAPAATEPGPSEREEGGSSSLKKADERHLDSK